MSASLIHSTLRLRLAAVSVGLGLVLAACGGGSDRASDSRSDAPTAPVPAQPEPEPEPEVVAEALVSAVGFAGVWPFGTEEARVECLPDEGLAVELDGDLYALNGVAISAGFEELTLETPDGIWLDNPSTGAKVSLRDFTQLARDICAGDAVAADTGPTTGQKLALIDGARVRDWPEYERRIAQAGERCAEPEIDVADKVVRVQQLLDERGMTVSLLEIIEEGILASIPPSEAGNLDCVEVLTLYLVLTIG